MFFTSCVKNEFTLDFSFSEKTNENFPLIYYASDPEKGWIVESVATIADGRGEFKGITRNPCIVYVFHGSQWPVTFLYADRGEKIRISGSASNPAEWSIDGNDINRGLTEWRLKNARILTDRRPGLSSRSEEINKAVAEFVKKNPSDPVSTLLLLEYYDRDADSDGFLACYKLLKGEAAEARWRDVAARADVLAKPEATSFPKQLVLTGLNKKDTFTLGEKPMLLYFAGLGDKDRKEAVGRLKELARQHPDSSARVIAHVIFEPDSMRRWLAARNDSLKNVAEEWVPLGLADERMRELGVVRTPYVIVTDKKGKIKYRGGDLETAAKNF